MDLSETVLASARIGAAAFAIALTGAMAPGPFLTVMIAETVRRGRASALLLLVGHALLEAVLLVGFAFGLQGVLKRPAVSSGLAIVGGAFLLWMGATLLFDAGRGRISLQVEAEARPARFGPVVRGAAVSLSSPYWTLWWLTIGLALASQALAVGPVAVVAFFAGHELADLAWYALVVQAVHSGRRILSDTVYRWAIGVCAAFLVYLGAAFIASAIR
ncbi:MAG: lysine transporter LysE [Coriobacteriaceae bacterium]|nr:lysine transporter LysE [Coriobacteriaceae bacterium]